MTFTTTEVAYMLLAVSIVHIILFAAILSARTQVDTSTPSTTSILASLGGDTPSGYRPGTATPPERPGTGQHSRVTPEPLPEAYNMQHWMQKDTTGASLVLELEITGCSDPQMWYAKMIGQRVPYIRQNVLTLEYTSREPTGYANIIRQEDAKIVRK